MQTVSANGSVASTAARARDKVRGEKIILMNCQSLIPEHPGHALLYSERFLGYVWP